jgi:hypothetical protein
VYAEHELAKRELKKKGKSVVGKPQLKLVK